MMRRTIVACLIIVAVGSVAAAAQERLKASAKRGTTAAPRYVHEPDLKKLLPRVLSPQGFLDPKFSEAVAKPSPFYTDFFGVQALADTTREKLKRDFVPKHAEVAGEDEHTLTLKFKSGWTGTFYPHSTIKVMGTEVPFDHVYVSGEKWQEMIKNLDEFRGLLKSNKLEKAYLIPNPYYKSELVVYEKMRGAGAPAKLNVDPNLSEMSQSANAVLIYPEGVHGNVKGYDKFNSTVLTAHRFDWLGMEMIPTSMQKDLDAFVRSGEGTPESARARKVVVDYFANSWNGRAGPKTTGEENYYFKIVDLMRAKKTRVVGLENVNLPYIFFRYGETPFGGAVRSYIWAQAAPTSGRGLVYGGSAHFNERQPINFQDFLLMRNPGVKFFTVEEVKPRPAM
ncbi:MAG: hypothetical protein ACRD68_04295 [Pyrinomonadaceae bacterium]